VEKSRSELQKSSSQAGVSSDDELWRRSTIRCRDAVSHVFGAPGVNFWLPCLRPPTASRTSAVVYFLLLHYKNYFKAVV
jgi:hypothetical protein